MRLGNGLFASVWKSLKKHIRPIWPMVGRYTLALILVCTRIAKTIDIIENTLTPETARRREGGDRVFYGAGWQVNQRTSRDKLCTPGTSGRVGNREISCFSSSTGAVQQRRGAVAAGVHVRKWELARHTIFSGTVRPYQVAVATWPEGHAGAPISLLKFRQIRIPGRSLC